MKIFDRQYPGLDQDRGSRRSDRHIARPQIVSTDGAIDSISILRDGKAAGGADASVHIWIAGGSESRRDLREIRGLRVPLASCHPLLGPHPPAGDHRRSGCYRHIDLPDHVIEPAGGLDRAALEAPAGDNGLRPDNLSSRQRIVQRTANVQFDGRRAAIDPKLAEPWQPAFHRVDQHARLTDGKDKVGIDAIETVQATRSCERRTRRARLQLRHLPRVSSTFRAQCGPSIGPAQHEIRPALEGLCGQWIGDDSVDSSGQGRRATNHLRHAGYEEPQQPVDRRPVEPSLNLYGAGSNKPRRRIPPSRITEPYRRQPLPERKDGGLDIVAGNGQGTPTVCKFHLSSGGRIEADEAFDIQLALRIESGRQIRIPPTQ